jgi:hypothetical protein
VRCDILSKLYHFIKITTNNSSIRTNHCTFLTAQLVCPISYYDQSNTWEKIQKEFADRLPLREVTWKPVSSPSITIQKLPLRFMEASANLFKDTDHSFRWFLAAYVNLYILTAESLDAYKNTKPVIKKWVDAQGGIRK